MNLMATMAGRATHTTFLGKALRFPLRLVPRNSVVPVLGGINRGRRWIAGAGATNGCWIGTYEADHIPALQQLVRPGMVVYDVGANVGYYTLALSRLVGDSGRVYSFEPGVRWAYYLRRHIELNALRNVTVVQAAVSDSAALVRFSGWEIDDEGSYVVPSISLDGFIAAGFPPPDFIKMDIEGAEGAALHGARDLLSSAKPSWLLATHSDALRSSCQSLLAQSGYRFNAFNGVGDAGNSADFIAQVP